MSQTLIIDGKAVARLVRSEVKARVDKLVAGGCVPGLGVILAGGFAPSQIYVQSKVRAGAKAGIRVDVARFPAQVAFRDLAGQVERWNLAPEISGMIVQLPLPEGLDEKGLIELIDPAKDVDGLTSVSLGRLLAGRPGFVPATPAGIVELLRRSGIATVGRRVVIVGRGALVGRPLAALLLLRGEYGDATVTVCHSRTADLASVCRSAEILVVAAGQPRLVTGDMVNDGVVVVDAGTNNVDGCLVGDVDFDGVAPKARAIAPVPGGVGPMTVAMLLVNVATAAERTVAATRSTEDTKSSDPVIEIQHHDVRMPG